MFKFLCVPVFFLVAAVASAKSEKTKPVWHEGKPDGEATACEDEARKPKIYERASARFIICSVDVVTPKVHETASSKPEKKMAPIEFKLKKSYSLGFQASPQAKLEWLVDEDAGESHARTVVLTADGALIYSDDQGGHHIVSRSIECHGETCLLRSSKCMVKSTPQSRKVVADLTDRMETAKDKLKLWREYFFEGKHRKDGDLVVNEAILGSGDARDLTETDKALDGRAGEVFTQLQSDIDEFAKTCARDKKKKSK